MKTKLIILLLTAVALFSFTVVTVEKSNKKETKVASTSKPGSGLSVEDRNQWN